MLGCEKISGLAKPWSEGVLGEIGKNFRDVPWEVLGGSGEIDSEPPLRQRWQANFLPPPPPPPPRPPPRAHVVFRGWRASI